MKKTIKVLLVLCILFAALGESLAYARPIRFIQKMSVVPFSPRSLAGLAFWFDASDAGSISIATGVSQWNDKSGNGYHATQGTAGNQPTYTIGGMNGRNVLTFSNASQQYMLFQGSMKPNTIAMVWKSSSTPWADFYGILSARDGAATLTTNGVVNAGMQGVSATSNICGLGQSSVSAYVDGVSVNAANFDSYLTGVSSSPLTSAHTFIYTDDVLVASTVYYGIGVDVFSISRCLSGQIAELIGTNLPANSVQIFKLQQYLKRKWGTV